MNRLHEKGFIGDPVNKAKSVWLTCEGIARSDQLFREMFAREAGKTPTGQGEPDDLTSQRTAFSAGVILPATCPVRGSTANRVRGLAFPSIFAI